VCVCECVCVSVCVCVCVAQADAAQPAAAAALAEHLQFLQSLNVSGVSHHNLLYSTAEEAPPPLSEAELQVSPTEPHQRSQGTGGTRSLLRFGELVASVPGGRRAIV
jgi:hypothetical protein